MNTFAQFIPAIPEIFVLLMICVVLLADLFVSERHRDIVYFLTQFTLLFAALLTWKCHVGMETITFNKQFVLDKLAMVVKISVYIVTFAVFAYSKHYIEKRRIRCGEFYLLTLLSVLGAQVMISANSLLVLYVGLELLSLPVYALVAIRRESSGCAEAAMKYFVMGALASGMILFGMSLIYGMSGSLIIPEIMSYIWMHANNNMILLFGIVFLVAGLAFKFGAVPFHMWVPDVYEGAPTPVAAFIGSVPKLAAFAMVIRLMVDMLPQGQAYVLLNSHWHILFIAMAVLCLVIGNIAALAQTNVKRLLGYSTIGHVGFIFLALSMGTAEGNSAALYYVLTYAVVAVAAFGMILLLSRAGHEAETLEDFKGLNQRHSWLAFLMCLTLFSMAGIPPLIGFSAKLLVLTSLIHHGHFWLAGLALIMSVVASFYYLRIIKMMYFEKTTETLPIEAPMSSQVVMSVNAGVLLIIGLVPTSLILLCQSVFLSI